MENAQPEPSMEEILASIRRIISEDEDDGAPAAAKAPAARAETAPKPELTLRPPAPQPSAPLQPVAARQVEEPARQMRPGSDDIEAEKKDMAASMIDDAEEEILDHTAAAAATQAFRNLSQSVRISDGPGRTLEDLVIEMLRPMVKDWLDANLPAIVEEKVEEEVQRVARRRRG